jgi:NAD(P)-dependent dehydrogenase (short-subunit alcohol dehydrogenase family)
MSTAIITGASRGLGLALARALARDGWNLVIDARDRNDLERATAMMESVGGVRVVGIPGDVTDPGHTAALVEAATSLGHYTLLINNASMLGPSPQPVLANYPIEVLEQVFATNGTVINVTSDAATEGYEGWGGYGASKAALEQLSNVLAVEEPGITVFWLDPGDMNTRMHQEAFPGEDISDRPLPETRVPALIRLLRDRYPTGRYRAADLLAEEVEA